ncbi:MAG: competence/damage-inducible protein A [Flammeovirgaceae bacterium TMED32]|nr:MAG: competence/damage-inducible protein A [Flammeovirgaceae bacterium TMED32]
MIAIAEIISIGDELLYGQTLDTNAHWISHKLDEYNIKVFQRTTIGDDADQILSAFATAAKRVDIVLITGGLGPTKDDLTKHLLAKYFGVGMVHHQEVLRDITLLFAKASREVTALNAQQAELPANCEKITNPVGTAPGMWFYENNTVFVAMPGVPYEMKSIMTQGILPKLHEMFSKGVLHHHIIKTIGITESSLSDLIEDWEVNLPKHIKLAYLPTKGQVKLRMTGSGDDLNTLKQEIDALQMAIMPKITKYVYGFGADSLEGVIGQLLNKNNLTLATAESCTGGYLAHMITSVPGSSRYFKGSVIAYSNEVKIVQLGVSTEDLKQQGAVSEEVAKAMVKGVRKELNADIAIATTGIAGPDGGTIEKPVGTVWIAYSDKHKTVAKKFNFSRDRTFIVHWSALAALNMIRLNVGVK